MSFHFLFNSTIIRDREDQDRVAVAKIRAVWACLGLLAVKVRLVALPIRRVASSRATRSSTSVQSMTPPTVNTRPSICPVSIRAIIAAQCRGLFGAPPSTDRPASQRPLGVRSINRKKNLARLDRPKSSARWPSVTIPQSSSNLKQTARVAAVSSAERATKSSGSTGRGSTRRASLRRGCK